MLHPEATLGEGDRLMFVISGYLRIWRRARLFSPCLFLYLKWYKLKLGKRGLEKEWMEVDPQKGNWLFRG